MSHASTSHGHAYERIIIYVIIIIKNTQLLIGSFKSRCTFYSTAMNTMERPYPLTLPLRKPSIHPVRKATVTVTMPEIKEEVSRCYIHDIAEYVAAFWIALQFMHPYNFFFYL